MTDLADKIEQLVAAVTAERDVDMAWLAACSQLAICVQAHAPTITAALRASRPEPAADATYAERNQLVAALARLYPSGTKRTAIEGWDPEWHGCVYVDLPTGQASWHYRDREAHLFADLPPYAGEWDGHTTGEKYRRVAALRRPEPAADAVERVARVIAAEMYGEALPYEDNADTFCAVARAMIAALPRPAGGEDAVLPHDVTVGAVTFRKGVALSTLINAAERWHTAAMAVQPGPDLEAVQEAIESLPRPAVDEGATTRVVEAARRLADHMRSSTWVGPALDQDPSKEARLFRELHAALAALAAAQEGS